MNFFKKNRRITISFSEQEMHDSSENIGERLSGLPSFDPDMVLQFDLSGHNDVSTRKMASILSYAKLKRSSGMKTSLKADDRLLKAFRALKITGMFDGVTGGNGNGD